MSKLRLIGLVAGLTMLGTVAAQAAPGYSTANVNIRTGPDTEFPSLGVIPEGDDVDIKGCLRDESWCEVSWDGDRGWVFSEYLAFDRGGRYVALPDVGPAAFSIPLVTFIASDYWERHYVGRPWYKERTRWYAHKVRPRVGWRPPPAGKRNPGWWRKDYRAPTGLKPPPERDWRRPPKHDRDARRDHHRGGHNHDRGHDRGHDHGRGDHRSDRH